MKRLSYGPKAHMYAVRQYGLLVWYYEVRYRGKLYFTDNSCNPSDIADSARMDAAVMNRILGSGNRLKWTYPECVERAAKYI